MQKFFGKYGALLASGTGTVISWEDLQQNCTSGKNNPTYGPSSTLEVQKFFGKYGALLASGTGTVISWEDLQQNCTSGENNPTVSR